MPWVLYWGRFSTFIVSDLVALRQGRGEKAVVLFILEVDVRRRDTRGSCNNQSKDTRAACPYDFEANPSSKIRIGRTFPVPLGLFRTIGYIPHTSREGYS